MISVLYGILQGIVTHKKNPQRIKLEVRESAKRLDLSGIEFPLTIKQIPLIEKRNEININVFGYEEKSVYPIYVSKAEHLDHMELLYIEDKEGQHYVYIKDFSRLMFNFTRHKGKKHFCMNCLQCFYSKESLAKHREHCIAINGVQAVEMPKPSIDKNGAERIPSDYFRNHHRQLPVPFVTYADFESVTEKVSGCQPSGNKSHTEKYQRHTACSFCYKVVCHYDKQYSRDSVLYRGEDSISVFMKSMFRDVKNCQDVIRDNFNKPLKMTARDECNFKKATCCYICKKKYKDDEPVRDHCHISGKYRGSAHNACNLKLQISAEKIKIPVIFHNLRGYDSHFIINELGELISEGLDFSIDVIPINTEKYMAFYIGKHLAFIDSFQFMGSSLEKLAGNLSEERFIYTREYFTDKEQFNLMKAKGVYPYDYMDSFSKFSDTVLPNKEDFYSLLNDEDISDDDYNHAKDVWNTFSIKNMGEYHDLYLRSDVLLLAGVFENFRVACLENYTLDPCHYVSSPGLSWDAMLKMTGVNLELITDVDIHQLIERGIRGGISIITHRYAKATNPYMKFYNPEDDTSYIMYLDANNLYGWAMIQDLPYGGFRWVEPKHYTEKMKGTGYIYEVDLEYPEELHDLHNGYSCAAEKMKVKDDMLSDYCKMIKEYYKISSGNVSKLIPTLYDKERYVLHEKKIRTLFKPWSKIKTST